VEEGVTAWRNAAQDLRGLTLGRGLVASRTHKLRFTRGSLFSMGRAPKAERTFPCLQRGL